MNLVSSIKDALYVLRSDDYKIVSPEELQKRREESAHSICAEIADGSISLTRGSFITPQEQERARKEALSYKF